MSAVLSVMFITWTDVKAIDPLPRLKREERIVIRVDFGWTVMEEREREPVEEIEMRDSANAAEMVSVKSLREADPVERAMNGCDANLLLISTVTV